MAKMGQPMLPFMTGVASQPESSDSELEVGRKCFVKLLKKNETVDILFVPIFNQS